MIIASLIGLVLAIFGITLPAAVMAPFDLIGGATIPLVLMTFGMPLAGQPTAQNVFNFASRYDRGVVIARDTVLITTISSVPVLVVAAALLAP